MKINHQNGFTLLELLIAIAIVATLAATAMSFYGDNVTKSRCTEGRSALLSGASALEKCKTVYGVYNNANCNTNAFLGTTTNGFFDITMARNATSFTLTATAQGAAANDNTFCPTITLNNLGVQGGTGTSPW